MIERAFKRYRIPSQSKFPPVSVILAAKNEADNLKILIPDLLAQDYPEFEVIVVDNESSDKTPQVVWSFSRNPRLKYVESGPAPKFHNSKKWAVKCGIENARNEWMLLTDSDVRIPSTQWIKEMSRGFQGDNIFSLGISPYIEHRGFLNLFIRFETLLTSFMYAGMALLGRPYMGVGRNLGYKKSIFDDFRGYEEIQGGDDDLLVNRYANKGNTRVILGKESLTFSYPKVHFRDFFKQKIRHLSVGKYYQSKDLWPLGLFLVSLMLSWCCGLFLLLGGNFVLLVMMGWLARYIFFTTSFHKALERMEVGFELQYLIFLDFVYPLYYLSTAIGTLWAKKIQWTKNDNSRKKRSRTSN